MGLPERIDADAREVASELQLEIVEVRGVPWCVGSVGDTILCRWSAVESVRQARIWEGISQCLLGRLGLEWTADQARNLGHWLRVAASSTP
jgi:hypothetical protein